MSLNVQGTFDILTIFCSIHFQVSSQCAKYIDNPKYIGCSLAQPACLVFLSSCVASHHLILAPQSSTKDQFNYTVYSITLNSKCEAQRVSKNLKNNCRIHS